MNIENLTIRRLFLIDAIGAALSAILLGFVLVSYQELIGMPVYILRILAGIAVLFFIYSISCYLINAVDLKVRLRTIAIANFLYCIATLILMVVYFDELTLLGVSYFLLEIVIITGLGRLEFKSTLN
ncbi:hypothetical protein [Ekhidna sp.]|uniref:hypothetical protein n=1 Tax=Ekhidna sp. TaxID=2608089 RepID=UPI0035123D47